MRCPRCGASGALAMRGAKRSHAGMSVRLPPSSAGPAYPVPPPGFGPPSARTPLLPRRGPLLLTLLLIPLLGFVFFAPFVLLIAGDSHPAPHRMWMYFREGGWGMWAVTLCQMLL